MATKKVNPEEFLNSNALSVLESSRIKGGAIEKGYTIQCTGQYQGHIGQCPLQQQTVQNPR